MLLFSCGLMTVSFERWPDLDQYREARSGLSRPLNRDSVHGRAMVDRELVYVRDFLEVAADFPESQAPQRGYRTMLAAPLVRQGTAIGAIGIRRLAVRPFTDGQIALL